MKFIRKYWYLVLACFILSGVLILGILIILDHRADHPSARETAINYIETSSAVAETVGEIEYLRLLSHRAVLTTYLTSQGRDIVYVFRVVGSNGAIYAHIRVSMNYGDVITNIEPRDWEVIRFYYTE